MQHDDRYSFSLFSDNNNLRLKQCIGFLIKKLTALMIITVGLFFLLLSEAFADEEGKGVDYPDKGFFDAATSDWDLSLGVGVGVGPDYEGSDDYDFGFQPIVEASWRDGTVFLSPEGIGATLLRSEHFSAGVVVSYDGGRDQDDNNALKGLGDIDGGVAGSAFAELDLGQYAVAVDVTQDLSGEDKGALVSLSADYRFAFFDDKLMLELGPDLSWASGDYNKTYFGISKSQAASSRYNEYDADAGLKDVGLHLNAMYEVDENWAVIGGLGYARLLGDAADSQIVDSENQFFSGISVVYNF